MPGKTHRLTGIDVLFWTSLSLEQRCDETTVVDNARDMVPG